MQNRTVFLLPMLQGKVNIIKVQDIRFLDMIGQGGFGAVFQGKWKAKKD